MVPRSALVSEGLRHAAQTDFPLVVVVGLPEYYPRFGFEPAGAMGVRGTVVYPVAFT